MTMPAWWRRYIDWRLRHVRRLLADDDGFTLLARRESRSVRWDAVQHVVAYKRDLLTVDLLCLAIATSDGIVEIDEDMAGYAAVEAHLCERLPIVSDWRLDVLFPAFATNPTTLYPAA
ncbi:hypothetical protein [Sandarakinorhabdus sp. DWP1-3-1]|uniref:hypothetical protein n=1 Tax=Sandarakinorhabdus sp. DWP1-3-1 TaxID=2804627 RepID=UPI003CF086DA